MGFLLEKPPTKHGKQPFFVVVFLQRTMVDVHLLENMFLLPLSLVGFPKNLSPDIYFCSGA